MIGFRNHIFRFVLTRLSAGDKTLLGLRREMECTARFAPVPGNVEIPSISAGDIPAKWIWPSGASKEKVILYLHGGGYVMGSCDTHRALVSRIAKASGVGALSINYRLAPEHPFPAALEDSSAAYKWLLREGFLPQNIVIAGDSAGGGLALATLISLRDDNHLLPAAGVCLSPWTDLKATGESVKTHAQIDPYVKPAILTYMSKLYIGENDPGSPLISPLYGDLRNLPPLLIHVGTDEILLSDSTRLAERAQEAGTSVTLKVWDNMWHVFHAFAPFLPEANQAIMEIGAYTNAKLKRPVETAVF